jgi:hypothetical protein
MKKAIRQTPPIPRASFMDILAAGACEATAQMGQVGAPDDAGLELADVTCLAACEVLLQTNKAAMGALLMVLSDLQGQAIVETATS